MGEGMRGRIIDIDIDGPAVRPDPQQPRRRVAADEELAAVVEGDPVRQPRQVAREGPGGAGRAVAEDRNPRDPAGERLADVKARAVRREGPAVGEDEVARVPEIGRASCGKECVSTCRSRWWPVT